MKALRGVFLGIYISRRNETQDLETSLSLRHTRLSGFWGDFIYIQKYYNYESGPSCFQGDSFRRGGRQLPLYHLISGEKNMFFAYRQFGYLSGTTDLALIVSPEV